MLSNLHIGIDASRTAVAAKTGTEHYTFELLAALAQRDRVDRFTLYCNQPPAALPPLGTNVRLRRMPFKRLWTHARLSLELAVAPPDVLFVPAHVLPLGTPLVRGMHTVVTIHDLGYLHFPETHTAAQRLYLRLSTAWSARIANAVIAISSATSADLVRYTKIDAQKIHVIHHGVAARFRPSAPAAITATTAQYGIDRPYFLFVGTVQPRKNLQRAVEAFAALIAGSQTAPPLFVIAGKKGWLTEVIEREKQATGLTEHIRFLGYVPDNDLPPLLSGALAFVFPSLYEGFGMPVLEAMACGAPVITSTTSSLPEVAGDAALLVDPRDTQAICQALQQIQRDPALRSDLALRGQRRAARFTWDACAVATLAVLRRDAAID